MHVHVDGRDLSIASQGSGQFVVGIAGMGIATTTPMIGGNMVIVSLFLFFFVVVVISKGEIVQVKEEIVKAFVVGAQRCQSFVRYHLFTCLLWL